MQCDSLAWELAERGHREGCRSPYAKEPPRPASEIATRLRERAQALRREAAELEARADRENRYAMAEAVGSMGDPKLVSPAEPSKPPESDGSNG